MKRATRLRGWFVRAAAAVGLARTAVVVEAFAAGLVLFVPPVAPLASRVAVAAAAFGAPIDTPDAGDIDASLVNADERASPGARLARMAPELAPAGSSVWPRVCSLRHGFCVRPSPGTAPEFTRAALRAGDRAWEALVETLGAPAPEGALGDPFQVYLVDGTERGPVATERSADGPGPRDLDIVAIAGGRAALLGRDVASVFDRAASFGLVDRASPPGCVLDFALARAMAGGSRWRARPGSDLGSALGEIDALAHLATPCAGPDRDDVLAFQDTPEACLVAPAPAPRARGDALFFEWVDRTFGRSPGAIVLGLWSLAPTRTARGPAAELNWATTPSSFDVLAASLGDPSHRLRALDDLFVRFAVARATMDPPAARAWHIPWPSKARRLASPRAVAPGGASYVVVDHEGAGPQAKLRVEAEWEDYARMRWVVLKLDAAGQVLSEIPIPSLDVGTHTSLTVDDLAGVDRVLVVAANVGSTEHAFDPSQGEWEPHAWLLTLGAE